MTLQQGILLTNRIIHQLGGLKHRKLWGVILPDAGFYKSALCHVCAIPQTLENVFFVVILISSRAPKSCNIRDMVSSNSKGLASQIRRGCLVLMEFNALSHE